MPTTSPNTILALVKGLPAVPGDSRSLESLDSIDLLDPSGFSCDDYVIQIPNVKNGSVWADSPITNGRKPISSALGNVTETMRIELTAGTLIQMAMLLSKLSLFTKACNDFWESRAQVDPVYIKHQVEGEPGPRYALLFHIEIHLEQPLDPSDSQRTVTLSIEREYGWRGIPPGANPKMWTRLFLDGNLKRYNTTTADLIATTEHLISGTQVYNSVEWQTATIIRKANYIDIPASMIPGDLPAFAMINIDIPDSGNIYSVMLSRSTKPTSAQTRAGVTVRQFYDLAAAQVPPAYLGTDTTLENDTGAIIYPPLSGLARRAKVTFATGATDQSRLLWTNSTSLTSFDENMFRGTFAAFLRCRQVAGAAGDVEISLHYGNIQNTNDILATTTPITPTIQAGTGNTTDWPVSYMGVITIPMQSAPIAVSPDGRGIAAPVDGADVGFQIMLWAARVAGTTANLYVADLILIPIDECAASISMDNGIGGSSAGNVFMDTTGYFSRCQDDYVTGRVHYQSATTNASAIKVTNPGGQGIYLEPNKDNRIYCLLFDGLALSSMDTTRIAGIHVDIVPRWANLRNV